MNIFYFLLENDLICTIHNIPAQQPVIPLATLETKRKLEPKCVPHLFLKSFLTMRRSAELLANFLLHFSAGNSQNSLGKFTSFLKWRIAKTMKVAISRFDNAKPAIVMLIQLLTLHSFMCGKESILINILRIVLKILNN